MNYDSRKELYKAAVAAFGKETEIVVAIEEYAELIKELTKYLRPDCNRSTSYLVLELADVEIMTEQLKELFKIKEEVLLDCKDQKLKRLSTRITNWNTHDRNRSLNKSLTDEE